MYKRKSKKRKSTRAHTKRRSRHNVRRKSRRNSGGSAFARFVKSEYARRRAYYSGLGLKNASKKIVSLWRAKG